MTKTQQLNKIAQELASEIPPVRGIGTVMVLRGWYRADVYAEPQFGFYLNVNYGSEAADYGLGKSAKEARVALLEWQQAETLFS